MNKKQDEREVWDQAIVQTMATDFAERWDAMSVQHPERMVAVYDALQDKILEIWGGKVLAADMVAIAAGTGLIMATRASQQLQLPHMPDVSPTLDVFNSSVLRYAEMLLLVISQMDAQDATATPSPTVARQ